MVQKDSTVVAAPVAKRRGRPRSYEPDAALALAMEAFWKSGYGATTLDDLSAATHMNRPSLYAAFGDKQDIYSKAYRKYRARMRDEFQPILATQEPVRLVLRRIFRDCRRILPLRPRRSRADALTVVTAASEAVADAEIRKLVVEAIAALDQTFAVLFAKAIVGGELAAHLNAAALGKIATAAIHALAIRARVGASRSELRELIDAAVSLICGPEEVRPRSSPTAR